MFEMLLFHKTTTEICPCHFAIRIVQKRILRCRQITVSSSKPYKNKYEDLMVGFMNSIFAIQAHEHTHTENKQADNDAECFLTESLSLVYKAEPNNYKNAILTNILS